MSYRNKKDKLKFATSHDWNVIDDKSGFKIKASEAVTDHEGRITSRDNFDEMQFDDDPQLHPADTPILSASIEPSTDSFREGLDYPVVYNAQWDLIEATWDTTTLTWS